MTGAQNTRDKKPRREELSDEQWKLIEPLLPKLGKPRGRPRRDEREVWNGILWVLRSGARWYDLPPRFPPYQTCHRRFQQWVQDGTLRHVLETLAADLKERGGLDLSECFIDGSFVGAKKGAMEWERPSGAKVASSWQWRMALVFLSPSTQHLLRRMKSPLCKKLCPTSLSASDQSGSLETALTIATRLTRS
jgi:transposase